MKISRTTGSYQTTPAYLTPEQVWGYFVAACRAGGGYAPAALPRECPVDGTRLVEAGCTANLAAYSRHGLVHGELPAPWPGTFHVGSTDPHRASLVWGCAGSGTEIRLALESGPAHPRGPHLVLEIEGPDAVRVASRAQRAGIALTDAERAELAAGVPSAPPQPAAGTPEW